MNGAFLSLYVPIIAGLFLVAALAHRLHLIRWWRYRQIRWERAEMRGVDPMQRVNVDAALAKLRSARAKAALED